MQKEKCSNCGAEMLKTYTPQGLRLFVCPHAKATYKKALSGRVIAAFVPCHLEKVGGLEESFAKLTKGVIHINDLREATRNIITDAQLYEFANTAISLKLPAEELPQLFKAAVKLGLALGQAPANAIKSLVYGIGRRSWMRLDNIGIVVKANDAYQWYSKEYNVEKLNDQQKREAWMLYAIRQVNEKEKELTNE